MHNHVSVQPFFKSHYQKMRSPFLVTVSSHAFNAIRPCHADPNRFFNLDISDHFEGGCTFGVGLQILDNFFKHCLSLLVCMFSGRNDSRPENAGANAA